MLGNPYYLGNTLIIPNSDIPIPKTVQSSQKMVVLYQWFSTTFNKSFTPQMISQAEWHKANVYSSDLMDSKVSKLYALCKTQQTTETAQIEQQNVQQEHIEDINLDAVLKQ